MTVATTDAWDAAHLHFRQKKRIESLADEVDGVTIRRFRVRHFYGQHRILPRLARLIPTTYPLFDRPHLLIPGLTWWLGTTTEKFDLVHAGVFPHAPLMAAAAKYCARHNVPYVAQPMLNAGEPYRAMENEQFMSAKLLSLLAPAAAILTNTSYENELLEQKGIPAGMPFCSSSSFSYDVFVRIAAAGASRLRSFALMNCSFSIARYGSPALSIGWATYGTLCLAQYFAAAAINGACGKTPAWTRSNFSVVVPSHQVRPGINRCGRSNSG